MEHITPTETLRNKLAAKTSAPETWEQPQLYDLAERSDRHAVERMLDDGVIDTVVDRVDDFADDIFELRHPDLKDDETARAEFMDDIKSQGESFGRWAHFSWNRALVRYPEQTDHQELRTFRNKDLVTDEEQSRLLGARAAVFGLSVGSNVLAQLVQGGVGGHVVMGDFDQLSVANLNRIHAGVPQVGMKKIDVAAIKISELDPYVEQTHYRDGVNETVLEELKEAKPDLIFDEIDNLAMKAMLRRFAQEQRIPLMMATDIGDTSLLDVERYDLNQDTKPFHGKLKPTDIDRLLSDDMPEAERKKLMIKIVGAKHISPRMLQSAMAIDKRLGGLPQLGATAALGGSLASVAARELLIGRKVETGRYVLPMRKTLDLQHVTSLREGLETVVRFVRESKES